MKKIKLAGGIKKALLILPLLLVASPAYAQFNIQLPENLETVLRALADSAPGVVTLITGFSYLIGFWFFYRAVYKLRQYGELRTMMSAHTNLREPIILIIAGVLLIFIPTTISVVENTFFGTYTAQAISYQEINPARQWEALVGIVTIIVRLLGLVAFIRGFMIVSSLGGQSAPHATWGKAFTHIIGGALLMNIGVTVRVVANTIGAVVT